MQKAINDFGNAITNVGQLLAQHLDQYVKSKNLYYTKNLLEDILINNKDHVFRLLYYAPFACNDYWFSWHRDFGATTGLSCPIYLNQNTGKILSENEHNSEHVGLFIKNRKGEIFKASLKSDSLIFQIGEAAQIITHGYLEATPHCLLSSEAIPDISRSIFALFFVPKMDMVFETPEDLSKILVEYEGLPPLRERFRKGMTYGKFSVVSAKYYSQGIFK